MTSKRQHQQRNTARAISNEVFKKRRLEARSLLTTQFKIDDDKLIPVIQKAKRPSFGIKLLIR